MDNEEPIKGALIADLGRGVTLREEAEGNRDWVLGHLREGDQVELEAALKWQAETGATEPTPLKAVTVWVGDDLVGRWASHQVGGTTLLDDVRAWAWETTTAADKHWRTFVRMTLPTWRALWLIEDTHVRRIIELPWEGYAKTLRWQERYFRQKELGRLLIGDRVHIIFEIQREER